jgi:hypothetical protein
VWTIWRGWLIRPDFRRDPVHFKLVAVSVARAQGE